MRLVRFLPELKIYRKVFQDRDDGKDAPIAMLRAVMPSEKEQDHISLYEIADGEEPLFALAAFQMIAKGDFAAVAVSRAAVDALGIDIRDTAGTTDSDTVNRRHRDAVLRSSAQGISLARLFYNTGEFFAYERDDIRRQIVIDGISGRLDLVKAAEKANANRPAMFCELIAKRNVALSEPA